MSDEDKNKPNPEPEKPSQPSTQMVGGDWDQPPDIIEEETISEADDEIEASRAPLFDHLLELRSRLIWSMATFALFFIPCFAFSIPIFNFLIIPFVDAVGDKSATQPTLYFAPLEFFFTRVRLAFMGSLILSAPVIMYHIYRFVAPGLYKNERAAVFPFLIAMPVLFSAGAALVYFLIMPFVMQFAAGMEQDAVAGSGARIDLFIKVGEYLSLITTLIVGFGSAFQLPVVLSLLAMAGIVTPEFLVKNRRFAIVGIFLVAAILTPPDPISQIALGLTILGLYELSILSVRMVAKKRTKAEEEDSVVTS